MTPFHHHLEKLGWKERDIVITFWCIGLILSMAAIVFGVWAFGETQLAVFMFEKRAFWSGSVVGDSCYDCIYHIDEKGPGDDVPYYIGRYYGIRPVITLNKAYLH